MSPISEQDSKVGYRLRASLPISKTKKRTSTFDNMIGSEFKPESIIVPMGKSMT